MKTKIISVTAVALALLSTQSAHAQSGVAFEANVAKAFDVTGAELAVGYRFAAGGFRLTPMIGGLIYKGENDRYYRQTLSNGNEICRDNTNGQFAKDELCNDGEVQAYAALEGSYRFAWGEVGIGVRASDSETTPYATLSKQLSDGLAVKIKGGSDYVGAGLTFGF